MRTGSATAGLVLLVVVLLGASWLRFDGVGRQLIGNDELHTIRVAKQKSYWGILQHYGRIDNSVPMTLYAKALMDSIRLTELRLRAPVMLSSLLLVACPLLLRKELGGDATLGAAVLLATSPPAIFFSVIARPYSLAMLMLFLAVVSWWRWLGREESHQALLFSLAAGAATILHLFCAFPVCALFAVAGLGSWRLSARRIEILRAGALYVGMCTLFFSPGLGSLLSSRAALVGGQERSAELMNIVVLQQVGFLPWVQWLFLALAAAGLVQIGLRQPLIAVGMAAALASQAVAILALAPVGLSSAWARYFTLVWPLVLLLVAVGAKMGVGAVLRTFNPWAKQLATVAVLSAIAIAVPAMSPIALFNSPRTSFRSAKTMLNPMQEAHLRRATLEPAHRLERRREGRPPPESPGPGFLRLLREDAGDAVLMAPYRRGRTWRFLNLWQRSHGLPVRMTDSTVRRSRSAGVILRNVVDLRSRSEVEASGARFLVANPSRLPPKFLSTLRRRYGMPVETNGPEELYVLSSNRDG